MPSDTAGSDAETRAHTSVEEMAAIVAFFLAIAPIFVIGYLMYEVLRDQFSWHPVFSFTAAATGAGLLGLALYRIRFLRIAYVAIGTFIATAWIFYAVSGSAGTVWASVAALAAACVGAVGAYAAARFRP